MILAHVDHRDPPVNVDLGGSQADALGRVHGFGHVADQLPDGIVYDIDRRGPDVQAGIGETQNRQQCHKALPEEENRHEHNFPARSTMDEHVLRRSRKTMTDFMFNRRSDMRKPK